MRILIGSPLQQDVKVFKEHLKSLRELKVPKGTQIDFFWVVNDCPEVLPLLNEGEYIIRDFGNSPTKHNWTELNCSKMSYLRTLLINKAKSERYDYLFFIDTDLILHPDTLQTLLNAKKDLVSEVFWTESDGNLWCNAWMYDQYGVSKADFEEWQHPGLYRVGMTGACFLISKAVLQAGANYVEIPNLKYCILGEDRHFCIRAACLGFDLYLDTHCPARHLYTEREYEEYMEEKYGFDG